MHKRVSINTNELLAWKNPPKKFFLAPLVWSRSLGMIHAYTGVGKTYFAMSLAVCAAAGCGFLRWKSQNKARVLYIDGELTTSRLQELTHQFVLGAGVEFESDSLRFITPDLFPDSLVPNLATRQGQTLIDQECADCDVVVIDNLSTCARRGGSQTDDQVWGYVQPWLIALRARGKAVVVVHHSGKGGTQLGTSTREHIFNWILQLRRPPDYRSEQGAKFSVSFDKARELTGDDASAMSVAYQISPDSMTWTWCPLDQELRRQASHMRSMGMKDLEIATQLNTSIYAVKRLLTDAPKAKEEHDIKWD